MSLLCAEVKRSLVKFAQVNSKLQKCTRAVPAVLPTKLLCRPYSYRSYSAICRNSVVANINLHGTKCVSSLLGLNVHENNRQQCRQFSRTRRSTTAFYDVLEITPQATQAQVKQAFYRLSKLYHPDINKTEDAKAKYTQIVEAYETLGNKRHRRHYDSGVYGSHHPHSESSHHDDDPRTYRPEGGFKKRNQAPPTGRSKIYNYDEFYRMHYEQSFKRSQDIKSDEKNREREKLQQVSHDEETRALAFIVIFICTMAYILSGMRK